MNAVLQGADIEQLLVHAPYGFSRTALNRLPTETRWAEQSAPEGCVWVGPEGEPQQILIAASIWAQLEKDLLTALDWADQRYPDDPGVVRVRWRRMVAPRDAEL